MLNGYNEETFNDLHFLANDLADIFENNCDEDHMCSEDGMIEMGDLFENIKPEFRAPVFEQLLEVLSERDIAYDLEQFKAEPDA